MGFCAVNPTPHKDEHMAKKNEPPFDPQRHGRRRIDALYHRVMAYACSPDTLRRVGRDHDHPAGADEGTELCLSLSLIHI